MNDFIDWLAVFQREVNELGMPAYALLCATAACFLAAWLIYCGHRRNLK
jgi:hypothetical protein